MEILIGKQGNGDFNLEKKNIAHIQDNGDIFSISGKTDAVTLLAYLN